MIVNDKLTKKARERHEEGVRTLNAALAQGGKAQLMAYLASRRPKDTRPVRPRRGCPPWRTPEMKAKHLARKRFKAARRANR